MDDLLFAELWGIVNQQVNDNVPRAGLQEDRHDELLSLKVTLCVGGPMY